MASYPGDDKPWVPPPTQLPVYHEPQYTEEHLARAARDWMHQVALAKDAKQHFLDIAYELEVTELSDLHNQEVEAIKKEEAIAKEMARRAPGEQLNVRLGDDVELGVVNDIDSFTEHSLSLIMSLHDIRTSQLMKNLTLRPEKRVEAGIQADLQPLTCDVQTLTTPEVRDKGVQVDYLSFLLKDISLGTSESDPPPQKYHLFQPESETREYESCNYEGPTPVLCQRHPSCLQDVTNGSPAASLPHKTKKKNPADWDCIVPDSQPDYEYD